MSLEKDEESIYYPMIPIKIDLIVDKFFKDLIYTKLDLGKTTAYSDRN